ncbi:TPA: hypothetical protein DIC20_00635 [Candidatus Dependentiae bacterium]|nr:MAG: Fimbrial protein [candidate division TM6 bacterium GW2011_GWF2_36_131]KKQ03459.1 MAG: Fimbrial protein [candidate division TM6 bacterium GW2011_GWE2_36_25]KKQ20267.1 MAG: Fimbrial protein [candidate division TM6 bacterium GW2011_GWA2_36_9]HBR70807.1 hypothetical protein [Candidatus Dependentiae bacterium]HCU00192.1 hypothetical protein [Candidatus Dependentiae bacterium]
MVNKLCERGFTLIELMIVVAIIAFLALIAMPKYLNFVARAKRAEAQINLASLYAAEKAYWVENNAYTNDLKELGWRPEGKIHYTYGFGGSEGTNYLKGALEADLGALGQAKADKNSFVAIAVADIDGDGKSDVLAIDNEKDLKVVQDDLK